MKAKFNGKEYRVSTCINGYGEEWFEIEEIKEQPKQPKQPKRKFKKGDKVRIKEGVSSKTHVYATPYFASEMDEFIGKELTVEGYRNGFVLLNEDYYKCFFAEDWLEPWSDEKEELKEGDMAIFWDGDYEHPRIRLFMKKKHGSYYDDSGLDWRHAVKFECTKEQREQFNKVRKGEITL